MQLSNDADLDARAKNMSLHPGEERLSENSASRSGYYGTTQHTYYHDMWQPNKTLDSRLFPKEKEKIANHPSKITKI